MYLSPTKALENNWITGEITPDMIQPNGIDFTLDYAFQPNWVGSGFVLSASSFKRHRKWDPLTEAEYDEDGIKFTSYQFWGGTAYDVASKLTVSIPVGVAAFVIGRSTLNRNSIFLTSGLYDSGFNGPIGCQLHNRGDLAVIEKGARIGQIVFVEAASAKAYDGQYNNQTQHWAA